MESRAHAFAAGLFVILLGASALFAIWWFSGNRETLVEYELVSTGSITGLNPQAQVRYRGVSAGKVNTIKIDPQDPRNILVSIGISPDLPITRGTTATLGYQGVTGLAYVQLDDRGTDPRPLESAEGRPPRLPLEPGVLEELTDGALDAVKRVREISEQIGGFFDEENIARFRSAIQSLEAATTGINRTFEEAPEAIAAFRSAFSEENMRHLSSTLANIERASAETGPVMSEIRALMTRAESTLGTIDAVALAAGDGLIDGTLPQLNTLLKELTDTSARMGRLIEEIEATPQLLITGRSGRHPGPGEDGFRPDRRVDR